MAEPAAVRLAVLGAPIAHSRSPALHGAAYRELGLPWQYSAALVNSGELPRFLAGRGPDWRGLSLTMPLKREAVALLGYRDSTVALTGVTNTLLLGAGQPAGYNTDVPGVLAALAERGITGLGTVLLLGAGATALSVLTALARLHPQSVLIAARSASAGEELAAFGSALGVHTQPRVLEDVVEEIDLLVSTLPGTVPIRLPVPAATAHHLLDVAYHPTPTAVSAQWYQHQDRGGPSGAVVDGLDLLVHQAVLQVRIFVSGDPDVPLPREGAVLARMKNAVGRS